jgi:Phage integrase, N-terminal SAM-like domain
LTCGNGLGIDAHRVAEQIVSGVMSRVEQVTGISVQDLSASFLRSLRAENKSPRTVETYGDAVRAFAPLLGDRGMPTTVDAVTREHVEAWIQDLLARWKPATTANRYRDLRRRGLLIRPLLRAPAAVATDLSHNVQGCRCRAPASVG